MLKEHMEIFKSEGKAEQNKLQRQLKKLDSGIKNTSASKKRVLELYAEGNIDRADYSKKSTEYDAELSRLASEKVELVKQIPLLHKPAVIDMSIAHYCDEVRSRIRQCKDFETFRQFFLDYVDHIVYYKNLVELHAFVPIKSAIQNEDEIETKIEYKIITEIEWAERFANYRKKINGSRISVMDFNSLVGESKRRMKDKRLFSE